MSDLWRFEGLDQDSSWHLQKGFQFSFIQHPQHTGLSAKLIVLFFFFNWPPNISFSAALWNCSHLLLTSLQHTELLAGYFALLGHLLPLLYSQRVWTQIAFLFWGTCWFYLQGKWMDCFITEKRDQSIIVSDWINNLFCLAKVKWKGLHTTKFLKNPLCEHCISWHDILLFYSSQHTEWAHFTEWS